ncbi:DUF4834 family protein [Psychroflexus sp. ALD_RP9]|nr:DUF4834 family protein [Psychroflexus sp. ALD_RP9]
MEFLETLLIIILIIFGFRLLFKFFAPFLMRYFIKKLKQKFENTQQQSQQQSTYSRQKDNLNKQSGTRKTNPNSKVGEYIDYEELD